MACCPGRLFLPFCNCRGLKYLITVHQFPLYTSCLPCPVHPSLWSFLDVVFIHFKLSVIFFSSFVYKTHSLCYLEKTRSKTMRMRLAKPSIHRLFFLFLSHLHITGLCAFYSQNSTFLTFKITIFLIVNTSDKLSQYFPCFFKTSFTACSL